MLALLAGVKFESTFRTLAKGLAEVFKQCSTFGATRNGSCPGHVQRTWSEGQVFARGTRLLQFSLLVAARILISALAIFAVRQKHLPTGVPDSRGFRVAGWMTPHCPSSLPRAQGLLCLALPGTAIGRNLIRAGSSCIRMPWGLNCLSYIRVLPSEQKKIEEALCRIVMVAAFCGFLRDSG